MEQYNNVLKELLDKHAPLTQRSITLRRHTPCYDDSLRELKRKKRSCERKWVATHLEVHKQVYREACRDYKLALEQAKLEYRKAQIDDFQQGKLFQLVDTMMASKPKKILPAHNSAKELVDIFSNFFREKVTKVKNGLECPTGEGVCDDDIPHTVGSPLNEFVENVRGGSIQDHNEIEC